MKLFSKQDAFDYLFSLTGRPLLYAIKSPDTDLYDFGFGELIEVVNRHGMQKKIGTHTLHAICRFKIIRKAGERRITKYYEDTSCEKFRTEIQPLLGLKVKQVAVSDKNDLWLDFGDYWVVFATFENGEESWRFFTSQTDAPHLIASDLSLKYFV